MKESTRECWKKIGRYFFVERLFSTFWSLVGIIFLIIGLCLLPKALWIAKKVRGETRQALVESRSALRESRKMIHYLHRPFEVKIQLHGTSEWLDMTTTGQAIIAPQKKSPAAEQKK